MATPPEVREQVREIIDQHHGSENSITSREINNQINVDNVGSFPSTREIVREIVIKDQIPIVSEPGSNGGYYVAETEEEIDIYVKQLDSRIAGITERKVAVQIAANVWDGDIETSEDYDIL